MAVTVRNRGLGGLIFADAGSAGVAAGEPDAAGAR
jgi:hypothetical protein